MQQFSNHGFKIHDTGYNFNLDKFDALKLYRNLLLLSGYAPIILAK